jgi:tRNA(Ile)-lysidine synthase
MDRFTEKVLNFIYKTRMLKEGDAVVCGLSGGADSVALLSVLNDLKSVLGIRIYALHFNHMIRPEADEDEAFCRRLCKELDVPFKSVSKDIPAMAKAEGLTEEEAGRIARYRAFNEYAVEAGAGLIAVAHHQNDAAETLLMNLARGTGLKGAGGIRPVRDNVIRPLLSVTRQQIEDYLKERGISFCTDSTNLENDHTRNYIRNEIMPRLTGEVNSRSVEHLAGAAISFDRADEFIQDYAKEVFDRTAEVSEKEVFISAQALLSEKEIIRQRLVLLMFEAMVPGRKDFGSVHVENVLSLLKDTRGEAYADLPYGLSATRSYDRLSIGFLETKDKDAGDIAINLGPGEETKVFVPGAGEALLSVFAYDKQTKAPTETYTKWLDYDRIQEVLFRTARPGDVIAIDTAEGIKAKPLRKFMTDVKIPRAKRDGMYILCDGSNVLWVPGYRISASYKVSDRTENVLEIKIKNGGYSNG